MNEIDLREKDMDLVGMGFSTALDLEREEIELRKLKEDFGIYD